MDDKIKKYEEHKKNKKGLFPFLLFGAFLIILVVMVLSVAAQNQAPKTNSGRSAQTGDENNSKDENAGMLGVLKEINAESATVTLLDTKNGQDIILTYTGATDITDKYEKVIAAAQLEPGEMVDAYYDPVTSVLAKLQISGQAWEYKGVSNWSLNDTQNSFTIADSRYKYSADLVILQEGQFLTVKDLDPKDELVVKGHDREVWSILVTRGHGTIRFEDYKDFIGGTVYIGSREILPVEAGMSVTVQEGTYEITMEKESLKGTLLSEIRPFKETIVNMGEFKLPPVQKGTVKFDISPEDADLYIDNELTDYSKAAELDYGEHSIKVALGGFTTYSGKLEVADSLKTVTIDLAESKNTGDKTNTGEENTRENPDKKNNNTKGGTQTAGEASEDTADGKDSEEGANTDYEEVKAEHNIYIQEPQGANVYFDGQFKGSAPVSFPKVTGTHYITLIQSGYQTKTFTVEIKDDGKDSNFNFSNLDKSE